MFLKESKHCSWFISGLLDLLFNSPSAEESTKFSYIFPMKSKVQGIANKFLSHNGCTFTKLVGNCEPRWIHHRPIIRVSPIFHICLGLFCLAFNNQ